jgi:hypothetical protein
MYGCPYRYRYLLFLTGKWFLAGIGWDGLGWWGRLLGGLGMTVFFQGWGANRLRNAHLVVGVLGLVIFLLTGQYMHWWHGHLLGMSDRPRLLFRSAHIYLLWSSLLNTLLGLYFRPYEVRWCRMLQGLGSLVILAGPPLLLGSFFVEPWLLELTRPFARPAIYTAFGGTLAHLVAGIGELRRDG